MVARRAHNPKVVGSNPAPATKNSKKPISQDIGFFRLKVPKVSVCDLILWAPATKNSKNPISQDVGLFV